MDSTEKPSSGRPHCLWCFKKSRLSRCARCAKAYYCSRQHQILHWRVHRKICRASSPSKKMEGRTRNTRGAPGPLPATNITLGAVNDEEPTFSGWLDSSMSVQNVVPADMYAMTEDPYCPSTERLAAQTGPYQSPDEILAAVDPYSQSADRMIAQASAYAQSLELMAAQTSPYHSPDSVRTQTSPYQSPDRIGTQTSPYRSPEKVGAQTSPYRQSPDRVVARTSPYHSPEKVLAQTSPYCQSPEGVVAQTSPYQQSPDRIMPQTSGYHQSPERVLAQTSSYQSHEGAVTQTISYHQSPDRIESPTSSCHQSPDRIGAQTSLYRQSAKVGLARASPYQSTDKSMVQAGPYHSPGKVAASVGPFKIPSPPASTPKTSSPSTSFQAPESQQVYMGAVGEETSDQLYQLLQMDNENVFSSLSSELLSSSNNYWDLISGSDNLTETCNEQVAEDQASSNILSYDSSVPVRVCPEPGKDSLMQKIPIEHLCRNIINDLNRFGICVLDKFLGNNFGDLILGEVRALFKKGIFQKGEIVSTGMFQANENIRSDVITWVNGREPECFNISCLMQKLDMLMTKCSKMPNNGILSKYKLDRRTKAMVACYPGNGARYKKHVDNPHGDGRRITCIYYLNKQYNPKTHGGQLRMFPVQNENAIANIEPIFDRMIFFWSDRRNPHEVMPSYAVRFAITVWYFDADERDQALKTHRAQQQS